MTLKETAPVPDPRSVLAKIASGPVELASGLTCEEIPAADQVLVSAWPGTERAVCALVGDTLGTGLPVANARARLTLRSASRWSRRLKVR